MSISSISYQNATGKENDPTAIAIDKEIQALQKQKEILHEQIEQVKGNKKIDLKQKSELINEYQKQIAEIDAAIRAKEIEKVKPKEIKLENQPKDEYVKSQDNIGNNFLNGAMNLHNLCSEFGGMLKLRNNMNRQIAITRSEASKYGNIEKKMEQVSKLEDQKKEIEKRMAKKMKEIQGEQDKQIKRNLGVQQTSDKEVKNDKHYHQSQKDGTKETDNKNKESAVDIFV